MELRRKVHVTPNNYLDYLSNYCKVLEQYRDQNTTRSKTLSSGLNQLIKTADNVGDLRVELEKQKKVVENKQEECNCFFFYILTYKLNCIFIMIYRSTSSL